MEFLELHDLLSFYRTLPLELKSHVVNVKSTIKPCKNLIVQQHVLTSQIRSYIEYLIQTYYILVLIL